MTALPGLRGGSLRDLTALRQGALAQALAVLNGEGEETRLVGGAVRDLALGLEAGDFDLATTAAPDEVVRRARAAGFKVALTGLAHGTVTLIVDGRPIETTTLREDVETDGRHAKVAFGRDFSVDARRRDFTINALSLDSDEIVHDSVGGLDDLAAGRVQFIGDADARIREDYLRILRFFRFSARFAHGRLDAESLGAAIRGRAGMARLSRERVRAELFKLMVAPRAGEVVQSMGECGFLEPVLGGLACPGRLRRLVAIESARGTKATRCCASRRFRRRSRRTRNAFASGCGSPTASMSASPRRPSRSRAARDRRSRLRSMICSPCCLRPSAEPRGTRSRWRMPKSAASPDDRAFAGADSFLALAAEPKLPFGGADLIARGIASGRRVGEILRSFQALWIRAGFPKEPKTLGRLLDEAAAEVERAGER